MRLSLGMQMTINESEMRLPRGSRGSSICIDREVGNRGVTPPSYVGCPWYSVIFATNSGGGSFDSSPLACRWRNCFDTPLIHAAAERYYYPYSSRAPLGGDVGGVRAATQATRLRLATSTSSQNITTDNETNGSGKLPEDLFTITEITPLIWDQVAADTAHNAHLRKPNVWT